MKKSVYLETSVVSYLVARPGRDLIRAARQELTREWWDTSRLRYRLCTSQLVLAEAGEGDPEPAQRRLAALQGIPLLELSPEVAELAAALISEGVLPRAAADDAVHAAVAAFHGVDFLLTWNCRHLANAELVAPLSSILRARGHRAPVVCTPEGLMGGTF